MLKIIKTSLLILGPLLFSFIFLSPKISAAAPKCHNGQQLVSCDGYNSGSGPVQPDKCYSVAANDPGNHLALLSDCNDVRFGGSGPAAPANPDAPKYVNNDCNDGGTLSSDNCGIVRYIVIFINVLAALAGVIMVGSLVFAGIQYASSADDPNIISAAKKRIRDTIIALAAFVFMYAFLQWIIPGGVL